LIRIRESSSSSYSSSAVKAFEYEYESEYEFDDDSRECIVSNPQPLRLRLGAGHHDREVEFLLPADWRVTVCPPRGAPALSATAIRRAFARPVGAAPIRRQARGARSAVILVDDFRRPTPGETLCLAVIEELIHAGLRKSAISIVLGNGAHRAMTRREARRRLGSAMDRVGRVVSHDAFSADVTFVGLTKAGTPVLVNRVAADADFSVAISTVYPHALTAWGGGAKMVLPGICHVSTCYYHHTRVRGGGVWSGNPGDSPSRRDLEEAAALFGLDVAVCAVINPKKELCGLRVGHPTQAHRSAVKLARQVYHTDTQGLAPQLVIANLYPFDGDPTQFSKAEVPARRCGAPILILADFADSCDWHGAYDGPRKAYLQRGPLPVPERTPELLRKAEVFLYSPQVGPGCAPRNRNWYCESDWARLMAALSQRFPSADVLVLPAAPLQIPAKAGE